MANTTRQQIKWFSLIRILGLLMILGYHFFEVAYPGGFIGVDIFFVFSGYLITSLMIDEFADTQRFALLAFLRRRFYRIVPAVVVMILITVPFTLLVSPDLITGLGKQVSAAVGFVTNWYEMLTGGSYANNFIPHLFVHTWFLGVEMQFYLVWGVIVFAISWLWQRTQRPQLAQRRGFRATLFVTAFVLTTMSLVVMWSQQRGLKDFTPVYFSSLTHAFPLFMGALVATVTGIGVVPRWFARIGQRLHAWQAVVVLSLAALVTVVLGRVVGFDQAATYPGGLFLTSFLAVVMILAARLLHEATLDRREPRVLQWGAGLSYGIYLYHWPFYVLFSRIMEHWLAISATLILSVLFAWVSAQVIEPFVAGKPVHLFKWQVRPHSLIAPMMVVLLGLVGVTGRQIIQAPSLSRLESSLWLEGVHQDVSQVDGVAAMITAAHSPQLTAKAQQLQAAQRAAEEAAKTDPNGYQAANANSTAAQHHIPAGVSVIGDSVTLGTSRYLGAHVANVVIDAEGERTMNQALALMKQQSAAGTLREFIVLAVGTNALDDYPDILNQTVDAVPAGHKLILVTPYDGRASADWNSSKLTLLERALPQTHDWITLADWAQIAKAHPELFEGTDGVHFGGRQEGNTLFAQMVNDALVTAAKRPAKK